MNLEGRWERWRTERWKSFDLL